VETAPGEPVVLRGPQGQDWQPFTDAAAVATGKLTPAEWLKKTESMQEP
jgi:hypothetical protein